MRLKYTVAVKPKRPYPAKIEVVENLEGNFFRLTIYAIIFTVFYDHLVIPN